MSALSPPSAPAVPDDPSALRIVLFGMPDAGKTSLLGALSQAAHTQGRALHGHLTDLSHGLGELRNRVYEDRQRETQEEIVPYPVRFAPYGHAGYPAVLYDCDGRAANDFLTRKRALETGAAPGTLAWAILNADCLVLTVDASAPHDQIEGDFREFRRFLDHLEDYRQEQHAVGGLPVFLVLTKCDLLARDTIGRSMWESRIADRMKDVARRFQEFLANAGNLLAFGSLNLEVRATAVRRPALTDAAPQPTEPFGVAELFHSAFADALVFRTRSRRSHKRLLWTVGGAGGFLAAMLTVGAVFLSTSSTPDEPTLADRVDALRAAEGPPAARLGEGLDRRLREWQAVQSDPGFAHLPEPLQAFVQSRLDEGHAYERFRDDLAAVPPPSRARSLAELAQIEQRLTRLTPPATYQAEWAGTDAARERERLLKTEIPALRAAVGKLTQFYFALKNRATNLLAAAEFSPEWEQRVRSTETAERAPPFPRTDAVQGPAYEYDDVAVARADWDRSRDRLTQLRDVATALGLLGDEPVKAPLALPPSGTDTNIPDAASRRWQALKTQYSDFARWSLAQFPDTVRPELERRLRKSVEQANRDGQRLVLEKLKALNTSGKEEPADWPRVGEYLLSPGLADWRELVGYLNRLLDPAAENPAQVTAAFIRQTAFELDPKRVRVRIPDTLSDAPVRPTGDLVLVHQSPGAEPARVTLRPEGDPQRDRQSVVYSFAGGTAITYRPGDTFYAELPVKKGDRDFKFTWASSRTLSFQFERLTREPRMHTPDQSNVEGLPAEGVATTVTDGRFPVVPPMVPLVRFDSK
jgi:GTPase SAR1 family protein